MVNNSQHGFHNKRYCLANPFDFYNDVFNIYDETKVVDIIYLVFQKSFDKDPDKRLLKSSEPMNSYELSKINLLVMTLNQVNIVQKLLRKLTNWSASSEELLSINLEKSYPHTI